MKNRDISWAAVDWGTTHLRAWAIDDSNQIIAEATSDNGMNSLLPEEFEAALVDLIGDWLTADRILPVIACGMVGARQGWAEADYVETPCPPLRGDSCKRPPVTDPRIDVLIVPGLKQSIPADVMRGEETQIAGFLSHRPDFEGTISMPGTHCKWARIEDGRVIKFKTSMTGELFALMEGQSILRHSLTEPGFHMETFRSTVAEALGDPGTAVMNLFSIRADNLLNDAGPSVSCARLSGYLIASEVQAARTYWMDRDVVLLGADQLVELYSLALQAAGASVEVVDGGDLTVAGLIAARNLAKELGNE